MPINSSTSRTITRRVTRGKNAGRGNAAAETKENEETSSVTTGITNNTARTATSRVTASTAKKVKHDSVNRRVRWQPNSGGGGRDSTPERGGRITTFNHKSRITVRFKIPPTTNIFTTIQNLAKQFLVEFNKGDEKGEIFPYNAYNYMKNNLKSDRQLPRDLQELKIYFTGYIPDNLEKGGVFYAKIYIGHDVSFQDFKQSMFEWYKGKHAIYRNMVQSEKTAEIGFLLFSTRQIDAGALSDEMSEQFEFQIGLKWKVIDTGEKGKILESRKVRALIVEVETTKKTAAIQDLLNFYNKKHDKREEYPNGIRFRFVQSIRECVNKRESAKVERLRMKQQKFLGIVCSETTYDISQLDYAKDEEHTLRQMIMSINSATTGKPLFFNVDLDWQAQGHIFQFAPNVKDEAKCIINTLVPFLRYHYPTEDVDSYFRQEAIDRCKGLKVDEATGLVENQNVIEEEEDDDELMGFTFDMTEETQEELMRPGNRVTLPFDEDSVSTLGATPGKRRTRTNTEEASLGSRGSSITTSTLKTVENDLRDLRAHVDAKTQATEKKCDDILNKLSSLAESLLNERAPGARTAVSLEEFDLDRGSQDQTLRTQVEDGPQDQDRAVVTINRSSRGTGTRIGIERRTALRRIRRGTRRRRTRRRTTINTNTENPYEIVQETNPVLPDGREELLPTGEYGELDPELQEEAENEQQDTTPEEQENITRNEETNEAKGDNIYYKDRNVFRIATLNINSLPTTNNDKKGKNQAIKEGINEYDIDVIAFQEANRDWGKVPERFRWHSRIRSWWESRKSSVAYNTFDTGRTSTFQSGGTMITARNSVVHRATSDLEKDPTGLGRWTTMLFNGKNTVKIRLISAYRTAKTGVAGINTAYRQQQRYLDRRNIDKTPRKAFLDDLGSAIDRWQEKGEQIALLSDMNTDIRSAEITDWAENHNIREAITEGRPEEYATHNRGSRQIEGIWLSPTLTAIRRGYLAFGAFPTDHRLGFADIRYTNAFGHDMAPIANPAARRLKNQDVRVVKKWHNVYEREILHRKLHRHIFQMESICNNLQEGEELTRQQKKKYDWIIQQRLVCITIADKKCRKLYMNRNACSPELDIVKKTIRLLEGAITRKKGARFSLAYLKRLENQVHLYNTQLFTLEQLEVRLSKACKELHTKTKDAAKIREDYYYGLAQAKAEEGDLETATVYKQLIEQEKSRESNRRIKYVRGKLDGGGLTKVQTIRNGTLCDLTEKQEIEQECMEENNKKYHQTEDTPCMREPLRSMLGRVAETEFANQVLKGTFAAPPGIDQYTVGLLKELKQRTPPDATYPKAEITTAMFKEGWKKMKETTSAGHGIHFGHIIAATKHPFIAELEASLTHIPYKTGLSPEQWRKAIDVMLRKKGGSEIVEKLRTIVLCDANWNFNNKILGRESIRHAEKYNLICDEQYGSRPGRCAIEHALHKRLWYDILRQTLQPGILVSNDAKSCYDRVVHSIAALSYKSIGMPAAPVHSMLLTIQDMEHNIRTSYGDSETTMSSIGVTPYQGILQGNGASPTTWVLVSCPLIEMQRTAGNGTKLLSPIQKEESNIVALAFVDDTDLPTADLKDKKDLQQIWEIAQDGLTRWEGGLKATGGAIRPDKSFAYVIAFHFKATGEWKYVPVEELTAELRVKDHQEVEHALDLIDPSEAMETLGVYLAPDGNNRKQIKIMKDKTVKWAADIITGHLGIKDSWRALNTTIIKTVEYPLPVLTLTKKECCKIMAPVMKAGLNSLGMSKNYPRDLVYGNKLEGGLGIHDPYHSQGISYCYNIAKHFHAQTMTGKFLRCSMEAAMIEMGVSRNIFTYNYKKYEMLLSDCLLKSAWRYTSEENIRIDTHVIPELLPEREGDIFIMETIIESNQFKRREIIKANIYRKYLQVMTLAEILDGYGEKFTNTYRGEKDETRISKYNWPNQGLPNAITLRNWRRLLRKTFKRPDGSINRTLGKWYRSTCKPSKWRISQAPPYHVFESSNNRIKIWKRQHMHGVAARRPIYTYWQDGIAVPPTAEYITYEHTPNNSIRVTGKAPITDRRPPTIATPEWGSPGILWEAQRATPDIKQKLITAMQNGTLHIVSDGSYFEEYGIGAAGWLIDNGEEILLRGKSQVPGDKRDHNSYRSELYGLLCGVLHVYYSVLDLPEVQGNIILGCDGKGALDAVRNKYTVADPSRKHFDIINSIWNMKDTQPRVTWYYIHIDGHQDDYMDFAELDRLAQLNVMADSLAKSVCYRLIDENRIGPIHYTLPFQQTKLYIDGHYISGDMKNFMHTHIQTKRARRYWKKKLDVTEAHLEGIDWATFRRSNDRYERQRWLSKHITGFCGVGRQLVRYRKQSFSNCPRCDAPDETTTHVIQCSHPGALEIWNKHMQQLPEWMQQKKIEPEAANQIVLNLQAWHNDEPPPPFPQRQDVTQACIAQRRYGWRRFMDGFWAKEWEEIQAQYMLQNHNKKSARNLISLLQRRI